MKLNKEKQNKLKEILTKTISEHPEGLGKKTLYSLSLKGYGLSEEDIKTIKTPDSEANAINSCLGSIIKDFRKNKLIELKGTKYYPVLPKETNKKEAKDPKAPAKDKKQTKKAEAPKAKETPKKEKPIKKQDFKKQLIARLNSLGGDFFERFSLGLLERYFYYRGKTIIELNQNGGPNDGGIDLVIKTNDDLGFVDTILVQCKAHNSIQIKETDIRSFLGAFTIKNGTRGIFITTSKFTKTAKQLINKLDNLVGIDGDTLFELVDVTMYGIHKSKDLYTFDETVFNQ